MRRRRTNSTRNVIDLHYRLSAFVVLGIFLTAFNLTRGSSSLISNQERARSTRTRSESKPASPSNFPRLEFGRKFFLTTNQTRQAIEEDVEGRSDWFTFQRSYPSNSIPADARLRAWRETP